MRIPVRCTSVLNTHVPDLDGHYLNLPVVETDGRLVAIVDVLKLTYATLEQVSQVRHALVGIADHYRSR